MAVSQAKRALEQAARNAQSRSVSSVAGCAVRARLGAGAALAARTAHRPAQELGLLVLLLREAVAAAELSPPACRLSACGSRASALADAAAAIGSTALRSSATAIVRARRGRGRDLAVVAVVVAIAVAVIAVAAMTVLIRCAAAIAVEALAVHARLMIVLRICGW